MISLLQQRFALSAQGAKDLYRATVLGFLTFIAAMLPIMALMFFFDQLLRGRIDYAFVAAFAVAALMVLYITLDREYDAMFGAAYRESTALRLDIINTLNRLPLSYFAEHDLADIAQTIMSDVEAIEHAMSHAISKALAFSLFFPILAILLIASSPLLGLAVVIPLLLSFFLLFFSKKAQLAAYRRHYQKLRENDDRFQEAIENHKEIKSYGLSQIWRDRLLADMEESERLQIRAENRVAIPMTLTNVLLHPIIAIVMVVAVYLFKEQQLPLIYVIGYLLAAIKVKEMADAIAMTLGEIFYLDQRIRRIQEIRQTQPQPSGQDSNFPQSYDIHFDQVSFRYKDSQVLQNVSFTAAQNQVTAIVGLSGSGKSTILRLICGFYSGFDGNITIGDKNLRDLSINSLWAHMSVVFQEVTLFNTSVRENIRLGRQGASDAEVEAAARRAGCGAFIQQLPQGFDTLIGENGAALSGGERQRLSIARAFLKDAPILILDEIAASLDVENESMIQQSLSELTQGRTVLIISHRMKSIENVDQIIVIEQGQISAAGSHHELLKNNATYQQLVHLSQLAEDFVYRC